MQCLQSAREYSDFLVQKTTEQAQLEGVPFSDLEKRMMYFTESDASSCDDPLALNEEFETQYETPKYEAKISQLLGNAYQRLKRDDPQGVRVWDEAIRCLRKGDHYILVMWGSKPVRHGFLKTVAGSFLLVVVLFAVFWFFDAYSPEWLRSWANRPRVTTPWSSWIQRGLLAVLIAIYITSFFVPKIFWKLRLRKTKKF